VDVTVTAAGAAPVLASIGAQSVAAGGTKDVNLSATDADTGQTLSFHKLSGPSWATVSGSGSSDTQVNGTLSLAPGAGDAGTYTVVVRVIDGGTVQSPTAYDEESVDVTVTVAGGNADAALEVFIDAQHQETGTDVFPGETLHIKVTDNDSGANQNPLVADTVDVELEVVAGDSETLTLTENDVNSGEFEGSIDVKGQAFSADNGFIEALPGDTIGLTYTDPVAADDSINVPRTASSEVRSPVVVNEVMWMGSTPGGSGDEFIELKNVDEGQVAVGDWVVEELGSSGNHFTIPSGTIIPEDGFLLISKYDPDTQEDSTIVPFMSDDPKVVQVAYSGMSLLNSGETLTVKDGLGNILDQAAIGSGVGGDSTDKLSQERKESGAPGNWGYHAPGTAAANWHTSTGAKNLKVVYDDGGPTMAYDCATPGAPNSPESPSAADHLVWIMPPPSPVDEDSTWGPFAVGVQDEGGYILREATGQITVGQTGGGGALGGTLTPNAQAGRALFDNVTYDTDGTITVTANYSGLQQIDQQVVVNAAGGGAGVPHHLQWEQAPAENAVQNVAIPDFSVGIYDDQNQLVSTATDQVSLNIKVGTGTIGGTTSNPAANGVASFTGISFDTVQTLTLEATATDLLGVTREIVVQIPPPALQSVVADDPDDGDEEFGNGDTITFTFSEDTNEPPAATKVEIDGLLDFGQKVIGTNYTGVWSDAQTLVITIVDAISGNLAIDDEAHIIIDGTDNLLNAAQTSAPCGDTTAMTGDWGQITATPAAYGDTKTGNIGAPNEKDYYTFTAAADDSVKIHFNATSGALNAFAVLADSGDNVVASSDTGYLYHTLDAAGNYRLVIRDQNHTETGDYEFTLQNMDSPAGAAAVNFGDTVASVAIDDVTDIIPYSFGVEANDVVYVRFTELTTTAGTFGPMAQLFDESGTFLDGTIDGVLTVQVTAAGTVNLIFFDADRDGKGTFEFSLQRKNNPANVTAISYSATPVTGSISSVTQPKAYSFPGTSGDNVHVTFENTGNTIGTFVPSMYLYNGAGGHLINSFSGTLDYSLPNTSTYYLFISDKHLEGAGSYSFVLDTVTNATANLEVFLDDQYSDSAGNVFPGETLYIRVSDNDLSANTDGGAVDTVGITVEVAGEDIAVFTLTETGADTGIFTGSIVVNGSETFDDQNTVMEVLPGQTIVTTYIDPVDASENTNVTKTFDSPVQSPVVINEIMWMGGDISSSDEWIEIKNLDDITVDVSNWTIEGLGSGSPGTITIPAGTDAIPVDGYLLISNFAVDDSSCIIVDDIATTSNVVVVVDSGVSLLNSGEQLVLKDGAGRILDQANIAGSWHAGNESSKFSMERAESGTGSGQWEYHGPGTDAAVWHTATTTRAVDLVYGDPGSESLVTAGATPGEHNGPDTTPTAMYLQYIVYSEAVTEGVPWPPVVVGVLDDKYSIINAATDQVTLGENGSGAFTAGNGPIAAVNGRAFFNSVNYDTAETITLTATSGSLTFLSDPATTVTVEAGAMDASIQFYLDEGDGTFAPTVEVFPGEILYILVEDNDPGGNADPDTAETVPVSLAATDNESLTLAEVAANIDGGSGVITGTPGSATDTGLFWGSIAVVGSSNVGTDVTLQVLPGEQVTGTYTDPQNGSGPDTDVQENLFVQSPVVINEIMWMGSTVAADDEWIELKNLTEGPVDVSSWTIDGLGTGAITIPGGTGQIPADGYMIITKYDPADPNTTIVGDQLGANVVVVIDAGIDLADAGEQLVLKDAAGTPNIIDQANASPWFSGDGSSKYSMERNEAGTAGNWDYPGDGTASQNWHTCTGAINLQLMYDDQGTPVMVNDGATPGAHNSPGSAPAADHLAWLMPPDGVAEVDLEMKPFAVAVQDANDYILLDQTGTVTIGKTGGTGALSSTAGLAQAAIAGRIKFDDVIYNATETIDVTADYSGLAQITQSVEVKAAGPEVTGVVADDPDDGDTVLSNGDTLTFTFDAATNTPTVNTKVLVDGLLDFGGNSLGTDYNGAWPDNQTLVITVINAAGGNLAINDQLWIRDDGDNDILNASQTSAPSRGEFQLTGDWGQVTQAALDNFLVTVSDSSPAVETSITVTVTARDASNDPIPNFSSSQVIALTTTGATPAAIGFPNAPASLVVPAVVTPGPAEIAASTAFDGNGQYIFEVTHNLQEDVTYSLTDQDTTNFGSSPQVAWSPAGNPGVAHHLEWQLPPPSPVAQNETWGPAEVKVVDDLGDIVTGYSDPVVLDVADGHGSNANISGTFSKAPSSGVATFDNISYSQVETIWVEVNSGTLIGTTHEVDVKAPGPAVTGVVADDPDDGDTALSDGDTLTFTFDAATNTPTVNTKVLVDGLLDFGGNSLGTDYNGSWTDNQTLVITVVNAAGGNLSPTDTVDIIADGTNDLLNQAGDSAPVMGGFQVAGDWGQTGSTVTAIVQVSLNAGHTEAATDVHPGEILYIRVSDNDSHANTDAGSTQTIGVTVEVPGKDYETVVLNETGDDTGVFEGQINVTGSVSFTPDGTLQALPGQTINTAYTDPEDAGSNTNVTVDYDSPVESPVVINEIMWMGSTVAVADEWIEIKNLSDDPRDLSGWTVDGLGAGAGAISIPGDTPPIPANGYMVITNFDAAVPNSSIVADDLGINVVVVVNSDIDLDDNGEQLVLKDAQGTPNVMDIANDSPWFFGDNTNLYSMERVETGMAGDWDYPGEGTNNANWHTCTAAANLQLMYDDQGAPSVIYDGATPGAHNSPASAPAADHLAWIMPPPTPVAQNEPWGPFAVAVQDNKNYIVLSQTGDVTIGKSDGTGALAATGGLVRAVQGGRVLYDDVTYDTVETITVTADYSGLTQITESVEVKLQGPIVTGVEADDPTNVDMELSNGDFITISFAESTNAPTVDSKAAIDDLIDFGGKSLGTDYSGAWSTTTNTNDTLVITVINSVGGNLAINDQIFIMDDGNNDILNEAQTSAPVKGGFTLTGDWGFMNP